LWREWIRATFLPGIPADKKMRVKIVLYHSRVYDKDNAFGACKIVVDAIKHWKLIVDDSPDWMDLQVSQDICPHKRRHTVIELEEA
jgi:hypothetical protein